MDFPMRARGGSRGRREPDVRRIADAHWKLRAAVVSVIMLRCAR